jgi:hypothetical protein
MTPPFAASCKSLVVHCLCSTQLHAPGSVVQKLQKPRRVIVNRKTDMLLNPPFPLILSAPDGAPCPAVFVAPGHTPILRDPAWGVTAAVATASGHGVDSLLKCRRSLDLASQPDWDIPSTPRAPEICGWVISTGDALAQLLEPSDWPKSVSNACDEYLYLISHVINGAEEISPLIQAIAADPNEQALHTHPFFDRAAAISTGALLIAKVFLKPLALHHMIVETGPAKFKVSKQLLDFRWQLNFAEGFAYDGNHINDDENGLGTRRRVAAFERAWARIHSPKDGAKEFHRRAKKAERRLKKVAAKLAKAGKHSKVARFAAIARYLAPA